MTEITDHLEETAGHVATALQRAGRRPDSAFIVAISKNQHASAIEQAFQSGQRHFGESYIQELEAKLPALATLPIVWHFIGRIQSNKTRAIAGHCDWVHTIDRARIARRLNEHRRGKPLNVLIQVNQAGEAQKGGVSEDEAVDLAGQIAAMANLRLRGLMCIPPAAATRAHRQGYFRALARLQSRLMREGFELDTLSMGMSGDYRDALACGSTCVRIGTAIFGPRRD